MKREYGQLGLPGRLFAGENPSAKSTSRTSRSTEAWTRQYRSKARPNTLRRGLVFQDGKRLQRCRLRDLAKLSGAYRVENDGLTLHVRPLDRSRSEPRPVRGNHARLRFRPRRSWIRLHPRQGVHDPALRQLLSQAATGGDFHARGHHWIIEENNIRQYNSIGLDIGDQFALGDPSWPRAVSTLSAATRSPIAALAASKASGSSTR